MNNNSKGTRGLRAVRKSFGSRFICWIKNSASRLIFAMFAVSVALIFPYNDTSRPLDLPKVGTTSQETVIAPFSFDVLRTPEELERERRRAMDDILLVMEYNDTASNATFRNFNAIRDAALAASIDAGEYDAKADSMRTHGRTVLSREFSSRIAAILTRRPELFNDASDMLVEMLRRGISTTLLYSTNEELQERRIRFNKPFARSMQYSERFVTLVRGGTENVVAVADLPIKEVAIEQAVSNLRRTTRRNDEEAIAAIYDLLYVTIVPNVDVNILLTQERMDEAAEAISETIGRVSAETEIVRKHQEITPDVLQKLHSLQVAHDRHDTVQGRRRAAGSGHAGRVILVLIPLFFIVLYMKKYKSSLTKNPKGVAALCLIVLLQLLFIGLGLTYFPRLFEAWDITAAVPEYLIPTTMASLLCTILFGMQVSVLVSLFVGIYFGVVTGFNHYFFLYAFLNSAVAAFLNYRIRYRLHFFTAIPWMYFMSVGIIAVWQMIGWRFDINFLINIASSAFAVLVSVFMTMMLTPLFERVFDITTDMTLIELSDMNHPILKRLSIEAAGTYNHCILVGNLAESAAQAIGANALLARVASYYHDIGKIDKPDYYVENCLGDRNKHNKLSPSMSALIICSHVKEGVDLAKKHKLPKIIQDIIMQHHGNSSVSFFYEKALELDPHKQVRVEDFQYPGPPPQTREAAIIMLADSVEAASRSLATSSPKLLRELVKKIIRDKFLSSQLDQCNLTLRDLNDITDGFMPILQGIFHTRIEYPKN